MRTLNHECAWIIPSYILGHVDSIGKVSVAPAPVALVRIHPLRISSIAHLVLSVVE